MIFSANGGGHGRSHNNCYSLFSVLVLCFNCSLYLSFVSVIYYLRKYFLLKLVQNEMQWSRNAILLEGENNFRPPKMCLSVEILSLESEQLSDSQLTIIIPGLGFWLIFSFAKSQ